MGADERFRKALIEALSRWKTTLLDPQLDALARHYSLMVEANRSINLTRITDPVEAAVKHYADSLALLLWERRDEPEVRTVLDIGTGAGFPAVLLAIVRPAWNVTALDGTRKKVQFLQGVVGELALRNLEPVWAHSEHWPSTARFDLVTFRALGPLAKGLSLAVPFLAPNGWVVAYKSVPMSVEEVDAAHAVARDSHLTACDPLLYELEILGEVVRRQLLVCKRPGS